MENKTGIHEMFDLPILNELTTLNLNFYVLSRNHINKQWLLFAMIAMENKIHGHFQNKDA